MPKKYFQRTPLLSGDDVTAKREEIRTYFHTTLDRDENLFVTLSKDESFYEKPITLRHPLIFYFGHTATFFINKLILTGQITERINPHFESIFAIGVDEMSWDDLDTANYDWPTIEAVRAYRQTMRGIVDSLISDMPLTLPITWESPWWAILMGIEHARIHLETSSVLIRQHAIEYVQPHRDWEPCRESGAAPQNQMLNVPAGSVKIGKDFENPITYGWDNEFGQYEATVPAFQASQYLVSNQEFLAFVEANGYTTEAYWEEEGRSWKAFSSAKHPTFWVKKTGEWLLRLMTEEVPMPWNWPVDVNYHEAKAFCNWKAATISQPVRLPTEDEWYRLYDSAGIHEVPPNKPASGNLHLDYYASSCPVNTFKQGEFFDIVGNAWQWTETPTYPFEGFDVHPIYDDFTTPTFDDQHNSIKGGSWISSGNETLRSARYAFRRHFFQHAGFRYVISDTPLTQRSSRYETDKTLAEYAEFHYGSAYFDVPNFPKTMAEIAIAAMGDRPAHKALDLGCAAGRSTFELARHFDRVTGIDFSARLIGLGVQLIQQNTLRYTLTDEGDLVSYKERSLANLDLDHVKEKVEFLQGDACNLKAIFSGYDLILAANLIDRLYDPMKMLTTVRKRLKTGGLLMIASPYTWSAEHTDKKRWIGGYKKDGDNFTTLDGLVDILKPHFKLIQEPLTVPFVIRETKRKFQHTLSEVTIWEKQS